MSNETLQRENARLLRFVEEIDTIMSDDTLTNEQANDQVVAATRRVQAPVKGTPFDEELTPHGPFVVLNPENLSRSARGKGPSFLALGGWATDIERAFRFETIASALARCRGDAGDRVIPLADVDAHR